MTREQMAEIFEKCAERRGYFLDFETDEKCLIASYEFQSSNKWLYDYLLRRTILIYNNGDMTIALDAEMNISERKFPAMKKLLEQLTEKNEAVAFLLKENGNIRIIMRCDYTGEIWENEEIVDGFYDLPLLALQHNAKKIIQVANKKFSFKERLNMMKRKKADVGWEEEEMDSFDKIRYRYEHNFLPEWFYDDTEDLVSKVRERKRIFLYEKMDILCEDVGEEMKYSRDQYRVYPCIRGKGFSVICIEMPEPKKASLCFQIYLVFSEDYRKKMYFTVEKVKNLRIRFLCSWRLEKKELSHVNYGEGYEDIKKNVKKIVKIFKDEFR